MVAWAVVFTETLECKADAITVEVEQVVADRPRLSSSFRNCRISHLNGWNRLTLSCASCWIYRIHTLYYQKSRRAFFALAAALCTCYPTQPSKGLAEIASHLPASAPPCPLEDSVLRRPQPLPAAFLVHHPWL